MSLFFELLQIALGNREAELSATPSAEDWAAVYEEAKRQAVMGLILAGLERLPKEQLPPKKPTLIQWVGKVHLLEQRNKDMNVFVARLFRELKDKGVNVMLAKGQGIAQCYEKPLWRECGDIDLVIDKEHYELAKVVLTTMAEKVEEENSEILHLAMTINGWTVELHGTLRSGLWSQMNRVVDDVQKETFRENKMRIWLNNGVEVPLPSPDSDIIFVFSHILQHFFREGIGLRHVCDLSRLLMIFKDEIDKDLLETRLIRMGAMSEWRVFASLAREWLGMPVDCIPLFSNERRWTRKAHRAMAFMMETGNLGHNRDYSYYHKYPTFVYKSISFGRHCRDFTKYLCIFPFDSIKVWVGMIRLGIKTVMMGK